MVRKLSLYLVCCIALVTLAFGQVGVTGSINGKVTDSTGAPIPGAKVTATGTTLIGEETQATTEQGLYRFPTLPAGVYKVQYEAQGFGTQVRENITINAGFAAEINPTMNVASQQQSVEVTSEAPLVDTENSNTENSISRLQMSNLPNSRDVWSLMGVTPGMNVATIDVGGSNAGNQPGYSAYGYGTSGAGGSATTYGNQYITIDGVNTTEARNGTGMYSDYGSLAEFTMSTQGNDASVPTPGVYVASVLKSGSNELHGTFYFDYENPNFQAHNISTTQLEEGAGTGQRTTRYRDANGDIGGKIIKDRLWYYVSMRNQQLGTTTTGFPANNPGAGPANTILLQNITEKLSGQINRNHRITEFITWGRKNIPYRNESATTYADAVYDQTLLPWAGAVTYDGIISPKFVTQVRIGSWGYNWLTSVYGGPNGQILPRQYELQDTNVAGSFAPFRENRRRAQFTPSGSYFLDNFLGTNHQLKFGFTYEREFFGHEEYGPLNGVVQIYSSPAGADFTVPSEVGLLNSPTREKDYVTHDGLYLTDQFKVGKRLTLYLGVRWDYWNAYEPQETVDMSGAFSAFYYAGAALPNGFSIPATAANGIIPARTVMHYPGDISPRIGLAYDLTGKGKTILKMNWGRFYQNMAADFGSSSVNGVQYVGGTFSAGTYGVGTGFLFKWNDPTNAPFNLSQLGANVGGSSAQGVTVAPGIKDPVLDDAGIFLEHQLTNTLSVRAGFVYRFLHNDWQVVNTALTSNLFTNPVSFVDPGPDGVTGTADDRNITLLDLPTGSKVPVGQTEIETPAGNFAQYTNYEAEVNKRMSSRFSVLGSFYWTGQHYLANGVATTPLLAINNYVKDHYWTSHFSGTYQARWGINISPILRMQQGSPLDRTMSFKLPVDGSQTIIVDPYGKYHNQNIYLFDTRLEKQFKIHERYNIGAFFDVFNMFNSNANQTEGATTGVSTVTINSVKYSYAKFLAPTAVLPPRVFRLGVKFSF